MRIATIQNKRKVIKTIKTTIIRTITIRITTIRITTIRTTMQTTTIMITSITTQSQSRTMRNMPNLLLTTTPATITSPVKALGTSNGNKKAMQLSRPIRQLIRQINMQKIS